MFPGADSAILDRVRRNNAGSRNECRFAKARAPGQVIALAAPTS